MRALISAAAVAAAVVLTATTATGCAGAGATSSTSLGGAASLVPDDAVAFAAVDTNASSGQWRAVDSLLAELPGHDAWLAGLRRSFEQRTKLSWADDVRPALGPEVDLVALAGSPPRLVALTQPADRAKLDALVAKAGGGLTSRSVGGWTAISKSGDALAALEHVTAPLADSSAYEAATSRLSGDALVHVYVDGASAQRLLASLPGQVSATRAPAGARFSVPSSAMHAFTPERFAWGAADVVAAHDGLRVEAFTHAAPPSQSALDHAFLQQLRIEPYAALLPDEIPADALLVADWQSATTGFEEAPSSALPAWLRALQAKSPNLQRDLQSVLGGETAIYVRPGLPVPEVTLVTQPVDVDQALSHLPDAVSELKSAFPMLAQLTVHHTVVGGQLVVSTSQNGIATFLAPGPRLRDDATFQAAAKAAGMPQQTTGFVYANLQDVLPLLSAAVPGAAGLGDLGALRSLVAYGTRAGAESSYTVFLEVH